MLISIALQRGWRAVLISDCCTEGEPSLSRVWVGLGWLTLAVGGVARCFFGSRKGEGRQKRHDSPDGRSLTVIVPCAGRGLRGNFFCFVSVHGPVSVLVWSHKKAYLAPIQRAPLSKEQTKGLFKLCKGPVPGSPPLACTRPQECLVILLNKSYFIVCKGGAKRGLAKT